jgi:protein-disulfide isomerase
VSAGRLAPPVSDRDHAQGDPAAPLTLVEYGDYECPYCGQAYPIIKRVQAHFGARLRFVFRNFPLAESHPHAEHAAEAAESVAAHGGDGPFWAMHDLLYEHQHAGPEALGDAALGKLATRAGVDGKLVLADIEAGSLEARVKEDFMSGVRSGVNGTPTFYINGKRFDGSWDEESLIAALEAAL